MPWQLQKRQTNKRNTKKQLLFDLRTNKKGPYHVSDWVYNRVTLLLI